LGEEIPVAVVVKKQAFMISGRVGFDWYSKGYLLNVSVLTPESQGVVGEQRLYDVVAGLEFLIPDQKVERDGCFDLGPILRMAWHCREGENQSENNS
jgi:hypothetical protein